MWLSFFACFWPTRASPAAASRLRLTVWQSRAAAYGKCRHIFFLFHVKPHTVCAHCRAPFPHAPEPCTSCHAVAYCSAECKRAARKAHKPACRAATQLAAEAVTAAERTGETPTTDGAASNCCDHCGAQPPEPLVCSGCDAAFYCTAECQLGAWPCHKKACRAVQKQRKAQEEARLSGPACDVCGVQSAAVFACPACQLAHYCGSEHQHDAWRGHKKACRQAVREQAARQLDPEPVFSPQLALPVPQPTSRPSSSCGFCGASSDTLLMCSQCKTLQYCSADHQLQHWSTHKPECRRMAAEMAARTDHTPQPAEQLALPAPATHTITAPACALCGTTTEKLLVCSKCKVARYCSADHQKQPWASHKAECVAPAPAPAPQKALSCYEQNSWFKAIEASIASLQNAMLDDKQIESELCDLKLTLQEDDAVLYFSRHGGADVLLNVLRQHLKNASICVVGLALVEKLVADADNQVAIVARGGLEVLFTAMRNHPTHADVNFYACWALANLAINSDNQAAIVARGGLDAILTAMRNHPANANVNHCTCRALANIALSQRPAIEQSGALAVVLAVVGRFPRNEDIQAEGR